MLGMTLGKSTLSGFIIDHLPIDKRLKLLPIGVSASNKDKQNCVVLFLPRTTPLRVWNWVCNFFNRMVANDWKYLRGLRVLCGFISIDINVLEEIGIFVKKCCSVENGFTFQILNWGIFYHNGDSFRLHGLRESDVPVKIETRWDIKRTGITICGLYLNGAQITSTIGHDTTTLRSTGPPSKGPKNLDELHIPIPIEEHKNFKKSLQIAHKVVEIGGISLVVRSKPFYVAPSRSFLEVLAEMTQPVQESISDLKTKWEYWKGVLQMEMIECRNKVIIQFQNLTASEMSTFNSAQPLSFISMCPSSKDREYWQRALHDLSEDHLSTGSNLHASAIHSTAGRIRFLLGEFDRAILDFDRATDPALYFNTDSLACTLLDRAMVKCVLARFPEATHDINMAAEINPNNRDLKRFQACLEDLVYVKSSKLLWTKQPVYDLLTGDPYPNLDSPRKMPPRIKSMEEFGLSSIRDWTEVREPSEDLPELDLQQGTSHDHNFPNSKLFLGYLKLSGLTGYDSLRTGEKLAEGGQAEIFEALGTHTSGTPTKLVLKVFKQAFPWQTWLQPDVMKFGGVYFDHPSPVLCTALGVKLLDEGRFAFVFPRHWGDLRHLIHQKLVMHSPFQFPTSVKIMLQIAEGMRSLHIRHILHRDLKASNILVSGDNPDEEDFRCFVADFECSVGVMGTGFWRAPEILTQLKDRISQPNVALAWSKEVDVYSFGMTCYEILTGETPFQNLKPSDGYVVPHSGERPRLPHFLDSKLRTLIELCWHDDPAERPSFLEICKVLADVKGELIV